MPSPELRCLECNRQFADLTADQDVERCAECGKFVVAAPTVRAAPIAPSSTPLDLVAELTAAEDVPTVGKPKPPVDDLPMAQVVRPAAPPPMAMPDWARRDGDPPAKSNPVSAKSADPFRPALPPRPATSPPAAKTRSYTELPSEIEVKKPRIGLALSVAFLFFVAVAAAIAVLGYVVIRGLKMRKVITQDPPVVRVAQAQPQPQPQPPAFSRVSES